MDQGRRVLEYLIKVFQIKKHMDLSWDEKE
jgi:hypothetical protein